MPVTAKLSKRFYDALGEDVANELVEWFNMVDATYRGDLRELNELNFARFDAKMAQRLAEVQGDMDRRFAELKAEMDRRFVVVESLIEKRSLELRQEILGVRTDADVAIKALEGRLAMLMFKFWLGTAGLAIGARYLLG